MEDVLPRTNAEAASLLWDALFCRGFEAENALPIKNESKLTSQVIYRLLLKFIQFLHVWKSTHFRIILVSLTEILLKVISIKELSLKGIPLLV